MDELAPIPSVASLRGLSPREVSERVLEATPKDYREVMGAQLDSASLYHHQLALPRLLSDLRMYRQITEMAARAINHLIGDCFADDPDDDAWLKAARDFFDEKKHWDNALETNENPSLSLDLQLLLSIAKYSLPSSKWTETTEAPTSQIVPARLPGAGEN